MAFAKQMENEIVSLSAGFHALLVIELPLKEWLCLQENVYLEDFKLDSIVCIL